MQENRDTRTGTIYAKYSVPWKNGEGESHYIVIEHTEQTGRKYKDKKSGEQKERWGSATNFIVFRLGLGISPDDYSVKDLVEVKYKIKGIKYNKKDGSGEGFFNELEAYFIRFADLGGAEKKEDPYPEYKEIREKLPVPDPDKEQEEDDLPF